MLNFDGFCRERCEVRPALLLPRSPVGRRQEGRRWGRQRWRSAFWLHAGPYIISPLTPFTASHHSRVLLQRLIRLMGGSRWQSFHPAKAASGDHIVLAGGWGGDMAVWDMASNAGILKRAVLAAGLAFQAQMMWLNDSPPALPFPPCRPANWLPVAPGRAVQRSAALQRAEPALAGAVLGRGPAGCAAASRLPATVARHAAEPAGAGLQRLWRAAAAAGALLVCL